MGMLWESIQHIQLGESHLSEENDISTMTLNIYSHTLLGSRGGVIKKYIMVKCCMQSTTLSAINNSRSLVARLWGK